MSTPARGVGIGLASFLIASAQGAGLMRIPALMPLCTAGTQGGGTMSGSLAVALAAAAVHTAAMLLTTGAVATGVCRSVARLAPGRRRARLR